MSINNKLYRILSFILIAAAVTVNSCSRYEFCVKCYLNKPWLCLWCDADIEICGDDAVLVDEMVYDAEMLGYECKWD